MTEKEMLKMALEALEDACGNRCNAQYNPCFQRETITAIKEALVNVDTNDTSQERVDNTSKSVHEPVQWGVDWGMAGESPCVSIIKRLPDGHIEVVAVEYGPQRIWVGLTDEEIQYCVELKNPEAIAEEIEAKLKEKNGL